MVPGAPLASGARDAQLVHFDARGPDIRGDRRQRCVTGGGADWVDMDIE